MLLEMQDARCKMRDMCDMCDMRDMCPTREVTLCVLFLLFLKWKVSDADSCVPRIMGLN